MVARLISTVLPPLWDDTRRRRCVATFSRGALRTVGGPPGLWAACGLAAMLPFLTAAVAAAAPLDPIPREALGAVEADSTDPVREQNRSVYRPAQIFDGRKWTSWCGVQPASRAAGQRVRVELDAVRYLAQVDVINGDIRSPKDFRASVQTRTLRVRTAAGEYTFELRRNDVEFQTLVLPQAVPTRWVELVTDAVHPGGKRGPCYSEVKLWEPRDVLAARPDLGPEIERLVDALRSGDDPTAAGARLAALGAPARAAVAALLASDDEALQGRAAQVLGEIGCPKAAAALTACFAKTGSRAVRLRVLEALGRVPGGPALDLLVTQAGGPEGDMASAALRALGGFDAPRAHEVLLRTALHGDELRSEAALAGLSRLGPAALPVIAAKVPATPGPARDRALRAVAQIDSEPARDQVRRELSSAPPETLAALLLGLGATGAESARELILPRSSDSSPLVRAAAARALGGFSEDPAAAARAADLARDPDANVRRAALGALAQLGKVATAPILQLVQSSRDEALDEVLVAVGELPDPQAGEVQVQLLTEGRLEVRAQAQGMLNSRGKAGLADLVRGLGHSDARVSDAAARLLARAGEEGLGLLLDALPEARTPQARRACYLGLAYFESPRAHAALRSGLRDSDAAVQGAALEAAVRSPSASYAPETLALLSSPDQHTHQLVLRVIAKARIQEAVSTLLAQLEQGHPNSDHILEALGAIGDLRALPVLTRSAKAASVHTRRQAVHALGNLRSEGAVSALVDALLDRSPIVRRAAEEALGASTPGRR